MGEHKAWALIFFFYRQYWRYSKVATFQMIKLEKS